MRRVNEKSRWEK
jgi:hypothetical protein